MKDGLGHDESGPDTRTTGHGCFKKETWAVFVFDGLMMMTTMLDNSFLHLAFLAVSDMMLGSERWLICCFMSFLFLMSAAALSAGGDVFGFDWGLGGLCFLYHFCCYFLSCRLHFVLVPSWIGGMASGSLHSFLYGAFLSLSFTIFLVSGRISEGLTLVVAFVLCPSFLFSFDLVTKSKPYRDCFF
ncbi:hypothetical protein VTJ04DRAFT_7804 [Mycothermus thermophilus]|uniref:uncharacterized protein n=1 Tax=Humicola insolens TaxID=85995 RepID=UPI003744B1D6